MYLMLRQYGPVPQSVMFV